LGKSKNQQNLGLVVDLEGLVLVLAVAVVEGELTIFSKYEINR